MILEITLSSKSLFVEYIRKERFYLACEENGICYYRKYWNGEPFIYQAIVKDDEIITHSSNPKGFQRLFKLFIKNKIDLSMSLFFDKDFKKIIAKIAEDPNFSFCFSESFEKLHKKQVTLEALMKDDFHFEDDELYHVVDKL